MTKEEGIARSLSGSAPGAAVTSEQIAAAKDFTAMLEARGYSVVPKSEAEHTAFIQKKIGGTHLTAQGDWNVSTQNGWVGLHVWRKSGAEGPAMFCPGEARDIAHALIIMAEQEQSKR